MLAAVPSAEMQLAFLAKLQRLFAEGEFTATYKFALLMAMSDLAVELGQDTGDELSIRVRQLGERFVGMYWRHAAPFGPGHADGDTGVLVQNIGTQAAVVSAIAAFRSQTGIGVLQRAARHPDYPALVSRVTQTVSAQPLNYLQNFGGTTEAFLYERRPPGCITLLPGIQYCLRRFHPLIAQLCRSHWVQHIKANRRNHALLGEKANLEEFLFSVSRQSLAALGAGLRKLEGNRCFYCGNEMSHADVDHYVPFSVYPRDLAENFVLAHPGCNRSKSDTLAARVHLENWLHRLSARKDDLAQIGFDAGITADTETMRKVASWAYASAASSEGNAWIAPSMYERVGVGYLRLFE